MYAGIALTKIAKIALRKKKYTLFFFYACIYGSKILHSPRSPEPGKPVGLVLGREGGGKGSKFFPIDPLEYIEGVLGRVDRSQIPPKT